MAFRLPYNSERTWKLAYLNFLRGRNQAKGIPESPGHEMDRRLAERIGEGDREALSRLLDRHLGAVYGYLARRLGPGHEEIAAEVTRSTFEVALRHLRPYARGRASVPMQLWLIREAGNQLARKRGEIEDADLPSSESVQLAKLRSVINALPSRKGSILSLALFEGMSAQEIAVASGVSVSRAMKLLRQTLKQANSAIGSEATEESQHG